MIRVLFLALIFSSCSNGDSEANKNEETETLQKELEESAKVIYSLEYDDYVLNDKNVEAKGGKFYIVENGQFVEACKIDNGSKYTFIKATEVIQPRKTKIKLYDSVSKDVFVFEFDDKYFSLFKKGEGHIPDVMLQGVFNESQKGGY